MARPSLCKQGVRWFGLKSWKAVIRNRTWDAGRATVGPHVAVISGQRRSLTVSPTGVCSTAATGRGILPSWSCEFDSRHPLHSSIPGGSLSALAASSARTFFDCRARYGLLLPALRLIGASKAAVGEELVAFHDKESARSTFSGQRRALSSGVDQFVRRAMNFSTPSASKAATTSW
jgi:hypothetical protein